jgi:hypothetical protein
VNRHTVEFYGRCSDCSRNTVPAPLRKRASPPDKPGRSRKPAAARKEKAHG